ncbi:MAG: hypothetical protein FWG80_02025 [Alphaproteobacteria bacterium]|nr:hypothetical protein [Alphaproteobacteria bacterium]
MKNKLIFAGAMGAILMSVGAAYAADPVIATEQFVRSGIEHAKSHANTAAASAESAANLYTDTAIQGLDLENTLDDYVTKTELNTTIRDHVQEKVGEAIETKVSTLEDSLGTAAYVGTESFDAAGSAATVQSNLNTFQNRDAGFATAAQGTLANTALQAGNNVSELTNDAGYLTSAALTGLVHEDDLSCAAGQMLLSTGSGGFNCVNIATGPYTE